MKGRDAALETYIRKSRTDVIKQLNNLQAHRLKDNLMSKERSALHDLRQRNDIIIKLFDKGSMVVMLSKEDYIKEANHQLNKTHIINS